MSKQRPTHTRASASYSSIFTAARHRDQPPTSTDSAVNISAFAHPLVGSSRSEIATAATSATGGTSGNARQSRPSVTTGPSGIGVAGAKLGISGVSVDKDFKRPPGLRARSTAPHTRSSEKPSDRDAPSSVERGTEQMQNGLGIPGAFTAEPLSNATYRGRYHIASNDRDRAGSSSSTSKQGDNETGIGFDGPSATRPSRLLPQGTKPGRTQMPRVASKEKPSTHMPLHRRLLFPTLPPDKPLPSIILSSDPSASLDALNERIHALLALLLRAYILSWYPSLTPTHDRTLLPYLANTIIIPVLSPILTGIYEDPGRVVRMVLRDVPEVLVVHWGIYWEARAAVNRGLGMGMQTDKRQGVQEEAGHEGLHEGWGCVDGVCGYGAVHLRDTDAEVNRVKYGAQELRGGVAHSCDGKDGRSRSANGQSMESALGNAYHARLPLPYITPHPSPITHATPTSAPHLKPNETPYGITADEPHRSPLLPGQQIISPLYLTSLSETILRLYLPAEEYASDVQRVMGREILGRVVLGSVVRRLGEGWFWVGMILRLVGEPRAVEGRETGTGKLKGESNVNNEPHKQAHGMQPAKRAAIRHVGATASTWTTAIINTLIRSWTFLATFFGMVYSAIRVIHRAYVSDQSPSHSSSSRSSGMPTERTNTTTTALDTSVHIGVAAPWLALFRLISGVDGHSGQYRAPWSLRLAWGAVEGVVTLFSPVIDRVLPRLVRAHLTPELCTSIIDRLEGILLPDNGYPGPAVPDPTPTEVRDMQDRLERRLEEVLPSWALAVPLATESTRLASAASGSYDAIFNSDGKDVGRPVYAGYFDEEQSEPDQSHSQPQSRSIPSATPMHMLEPLLSPGCNAHLVGMMLNTVIGTLIPELVQRGDPGQGRLEQHGQHQALQEEQGVVKSMRRIDGGDGGGDVDVLGLKWRTARRAGALADAMGYDDME